MNFNSILSGELPYTIDAKGRMSFPQKFREIIGERFVITRGANNRLVVYSEENWNKTVEKIYSMPMGIDRERMVQMNIKGAVPVDTDKLGRILVPQTLREYASLVKDVYVVGALDVAEIWDKSNYENYNQLVVSGDIYASMAVMG